MIAVVFSLVNFSSVILRAFNPTVLEKYKGISKQDLTTIIGAGQGFNLVGILLCTLLTEFVGRKPIVIIGFIAAGVGTFVIPFTKNVVLLSVSVGIQQLSQSWVYIAMMVRTACNSDLLLCIPTPARNLESGA